MTDLKSANNGMALYSFWSAAIALLLMSIAVSRQLSVNPDHGEMLFFMALALFHGIFAIWYWQGRQLKEYIRATVFARLLIGSIYWLTAWQAYRYADSINLPDMVTKGYIVYLILQGCADLAGAVVSRKSLARIKQVNAPEKTALSSIQNLEIKNRFAFAVYMIFLGAWILLSTESFLSFFHLPTTSFQGWRETDSFIPGPVHLFGAQVILLAFFNLVAVRYRLMKLINAGIRGGLFTCVFVLLLVVTQILHPITLLLPAVDLISVGVILLYRFRSQTKAV